MIRLPTTLGWVQQQLEAHQPLRIRDDAVHSRAAVAAIFRQRVEEDLDLLFIRRATVEGDPWSGHMAFPGGKQESQDDGLKQTACRETAEEVGLDLQSIGTQLGRFDDIIASARGRVLPMAITPFAFSVPTAADLTLDSKEVQEALWVPLSMLRSPAHASTVPYELHGERFHLPCFRVYERVIWGLTYQLLMRLFTIFGWELPG